MVTVLIVDDNVEIADLFHTVFKLAGMTPVVAKTIKEACNVCDHMHIDAMIVDLSLPDGKGSELLTKLHSHCIPRFKVLLTGHALALMHLKYPGFDEYLTKPVDCGWLCDLVTERTKS